MSRLDFSQGKFDPRDFDRFMRAVKSGLETFDYDSGWGATLPGLVYEHKLGVLPKCVMVQTADTVEGDMAQSDSYTELTATSVKVAGTKAFTRVLINT